MLVEGRTDAQSSKETFLKPIPPRDFVLISVSMLSVLNVVSFIRSRKIVHLTIQQESPCV